MIDKTNKLILYMTHVKYTCYNVITSEAEERRGKKKKQKEAKDSIRRSHGREEKMTR